MPTAEQVLSLLESIREISSIVQSNEQGLHSIIATILDGNTGVHTHITNTFKTLMNVGNEELTSLDFIKAPYMIYNDEMPGHFAVVLSQKKALIHEFESKKYHKGNESDAYNFMMKTANSTYLGNESGGTLRYVPISESILLSRILDLLGSTRDTSIKIIDNTSNEELRENPLLRKYNYSYLDDKALRKGMVSRVNELYGAAVSSIIRTLRNS